MRNASFSGDFVPGHTTAAPPGQADQCRYLGAKLVSQSLMREHHDVHPRSSQPSSRSEKTYS
ncbi:MAG: hypothetical protein AB7H80_13745 [Candidatus Kapaibacterium sp.]